MFEKTKSITKLYSDEMNWISKAKKGWGKVSPLRILGKGGIDWDIKIIILNSLIFPNINLAVHNFVSIEEQFKKIQTRQEKGVKYILVPRVSYPLQESLCRFRTLNHSRTYKMWKWFPNSFESLCLLRIRDLIELHIYE